MAEANELAGKIETATVGMFSDQAGPDDVRADDDDPKPPWLTSRPRKRKRKPWPKRATCSAYRVNLALTCMLRFAYQYFDQRKDMTGYEAGVGMLIHGVYEDAANWRLAGTFAGQPPIASVEELLHLLEWQEVQFSTEDEDVPVTAAMIDEARDLILAYGPLDLRNVAAAEETGTLQVTPLVTVGMYIDRIDLEGPLGAPVVVTIWDYKTNQKLPSGDELHMDTQANLYLAWARARYPTAREIRFRLENVRHKRTFWLRYTKFREDLHLSRTRSAQYTWTEARQSHSAGRYPKGTAGEHCRYCPFREGDARIKPCAAYQREVQKQVYADNHAGGLRKLPLPELLRVYRSSKVRGDMHEARKKEAREAILEKMGEQRKYRTGIYSASVSQSELRGWDMKLTFLQELAGATGVRWEDLVNDLMSLSATKVDKFLSSLSEPEVKAAATAVSEEYKTVGLARPKLMVREVKTWF